MKTFTLLITSVLLSTATVLAQDCKEVKTSIDKFSKKETKEGKFSLGKLKIVSFSGSVKWLLNVKQVEGITAIETHIAVAGDVNQMLDETTVFNILMESGEVVKLKNVGNAKPVTKAVASNGAVNVYTQFMLVLVPTLEELKMLTTGNITDVKIEVPNLDIKSPEISSKDAKNFNQVLSCMLSTAK